MNVIYRLSCSVTLIIAAFSWFAFLLVDLDTSQNHVENSRFHVGPVAGLGRVLDKSTRVQVQVLEKMTSTSTGFSKVLEYKYKYFEKYLSTSTEHFGCKL